MKIFRLTDYEWWIGETLESCVADYIENYTGDPDTVDDDAHELTDDQLDTLIFTDTDENERATGEKFTFREQLAREVAVGGRFPRMFASTEY